MDEKSFSGRYYLIISDHRSIKNYFVTSKVGFHSSSIKDYLKFIELAKLKINLEVVLLPLDAANGILRIAEDTIVTFSSFRAFDFKSNLVTVELLNTGDLTKSVTVYSTVQINPAQESPNYFTENIAQGTYLVNYLSGGEQRLEHLLLTWELASQNVL